MVVHVTSPDGTYDGVVSAYQGEVLTPGVVYEVPVGGLRAGLPDGVAERRDADDQGQEHGDDALSGLALFHHAHGLARVQRRHEPGPRDVEQGANRSGGNPGGLRVLARARQRLHSRDIQPEVALSVGSTAFARSTE